MYRGTYPTSDAERRPSPPPAEMLAIDMNRPPSIPSRPAPSQPFTSYSPYPRSTLAPSRPEIVPPTHHHRPRDSDGGGQVHAPRLPSLRTLLEPELLLDTKNHGHVHAHGQNPNQGQPSRAGGASRTGSSSPTLKRRHDSDGYSHTHLEDNAIGPRVPHVHPHVHTYTSTPADAMSLGYSTPGSTPISRHQPEFTRQSSIGRPLPTESVVGKIYRPPSTTSALSSASDPTGTLSGQPQHDDPMDIVKPMRRRTEGAPRPPIRSSR